MLSEAGQGKTGPFGPARRCPPSGQQTGVELRKVPHGCVSSATWPGHSTWRGCGTLLVKAKEAAHFEHQSPPVLGKGMREVQGGSGHTELHALHPPLWLSQGWALHNHRNAGNKSSGLRPQTGDREGLQAPAAL